MLTRGRAGLLAATAATLLLLTATGASALTKETATGVEKPGGVWVAKPKCDRGETAVSGGFAMPDEGEAVVNRRKGDRTWVVKGQDTDALKAYAYCSRRLEPTVEKDRGRLDLKDTGEGSAKARCGRGQTAVAGGWQYDETANNQPVFTSYGSGGRSWKVVAASGDSPKITAYAYCLRSDRVSARTKTSEPISDNTQGSVSAKCRKGDELLSGAFKTRPKPDYSNADGPDLFFADSKRKGERGWFASAHNYSVVDGRIKLAAICLG